MNDKGDFLAGLIVGGILGIAAGLLFAPATGDETRRVLRERADDTLDSVRSGMDRMREGAQRMREGVGRISEAVRERIPGNEQAASNPELQMHSEA